MYEENIERLFNDEVRDKKRTGRGIYNRASRKGYVGTVRTTVDYLKGKEKKAYTKGSEVKVSNVYDNIENIPSYEDFRAMEYERAKNILSYIKAKHSCAAVAKQWKRNSTSSVYTLYYKFGVVEKGSGPSKPRKSKIIEEVATTVAKEPDTSVNVKDNVIDFKKEINSLIKDYNRTFEGFFISLSGVYEKEFVENKILNILQTLDLDKKYSVSLEIKELD